MTKLKIIFYTTNSISWKMKVWIIFRKPREDKLYNETYFHLYSIHYFISLFLDEKKDVIANLKAFNFITNISKAKS